MKSRPLAQRDMTLRSPREIAAHVAFAAYVLALPASGAALAVSAWRSSLPALCAGAALLLGFGLLHLLARRPLDFAGVLQEMKRNPFKPARQPVSDGPAASNGCASGSCGL